MPEKPTDKQIRAALQDRIISVVAERTGIHKQELYRIKWGERLTMREDIRKKLIKYLFPKGS